MSLDAKLERADDLCPTGYFLAVRMGFFFPIFERKTLPDKWIEKYTSRGYMVSDPAMHWIYQNDGFARWSELGVPDSRDVLAHAALSGLRYGAAVSFVDPVDPRQRSFATFTRPDREFLDSELVEFFEIVQDLHVEMVPPDNLTKAELQALEMVKNGLLMKEIAGLLGVSEGAVKLRLKNAKAKLKAKNSTQAGTLATTYGLI